MTLRQLKKEIEKNLIALERDYGKNADVDIVIYDANTDYLLNGVGLDVGMINYSDYGTDISSFPYPLDGQGMLAVLTCGN